MTETPNTRANGKNKSKADLRIAYLSGFGLLGLFLGFVILFYSDSFYPNSGESVFHEVKYSPKDIIGNPIRDSIRIKEEEIANLSIQKKIIDDKNKKKANDSLIKLSAGIDQKITAAKSVITALKGYNNSISNTTDVDTVGFRTLNKAMHFNISPASMRHWDTLFKQNHGNLSMEVSYSFKDPGVPLSINGIKTFKTERPETDIEFLSKYPSAGIWLLTILIFCSFCFFAIALCCYLEYDTRSLQTNLSQKGGKGIYYLITLITLVVLAALAFTWAGTFYDEEVIRDLYFMRSFDLAKYGFIGLGYIAGAFCLAGFIYTASMLGYFSDEAKKERITKKDIQPDSNPADPANEASEKEKLYLRLLSIFNSYFTLSAVILTLMVLATGALYTTVNSLDFVKLLEDDWGYSPARTEFVLLYGALHSVILLLIYIPARLRFTEKQVITTKDDRTGTRSGWSEVIKNPFANLKDILIATSPLLASLVQTLFDNLFK